jgi:hypothetical protein
MRRQAMGPREGLPAETTLKDALTCLLDTPLLSRGKKSPPLPPSEEGERNDPSPLAPDHPLTPLENRGGQKTPVN